MRILDLIGKKKIVVGMIHLLPLPGTPFHEEGNLEASREKALFDSHALLEGGADGCVIQTIDRVYPNGDNVDFARLASVAIIVQEVADSVPKDFFVGVQILLNALNASLAIAKVCGGAFIRSAVYIGSTNTDSGIAQADPHGFQEYRKKIDAGSIVVSAEIHGLHYHDIMDRPVTTLAEEARLAGANIVEVAAADEEENERLVQQIKEKLPNLPIFLGGHTNHENARRRMRYADGVFVASCFQPGGWGSSIDAKKVKEYMHCLR
jgi:uncharacterized protein